MKPTVWSESFSSGGVRVARIAVVMMAALLLLASPGLAAVVPFDPGRVISNTADGAWSVHAADVDGDGDMDVLSASALDDTVAWYENNGASPPGFTRRVITTAAHGAASVHAADVDGDGDMDVLSASWSDLTVAWYENDGSSPPGFTERVITAAADGARSVHAADVDGDGDVDVVSASELDTTVAWYENDGASPPGFTRRVITAAVGGAYSVHAADVDGDGDVDVLSASWDDDTVAWHENDGGSPPAFTERVITAVAGGVLSVHAGDVDGDRDVDVLTASRIGRTVAWYENRSPHPDLTFRGRRVTAAADGASSVHAADVDGDGDTDILSASSEDDRVAWYENDGASPPAFARHVITAGAAIPQSVHAADVDGDGDIDVLSASIWDDTVAWYENDGARPPGFTERVITTTADGALSVYAADVDGDGDTDVLSASSGDDTVAWHENDGGNPPSFTRHVITAAADFAASVHAADLDGDGDMDVLSASNWDDTVAWYENDGGGAPAFTQHVITTSADRAYSVQAADVDGDGDVDVLSASYADDTVAWYENDGASPPAFTEHVITALADGALSVRAADVDGDGDMDMLSASHDRDTVAWYENDGGSPPSFTERTIATAADGATSVHAADVNGDGHVDILSASNGDDSIRWYENRPDVAVVLPPDGDPVDCSSPGVRATRPRIVWDPGPYDRFRVQVSWDPAFPRGERITSGRELLKRKSWRPGARAWRRACNNASPYLYIRVFGEDVNIRKSSPIRKVMSEPVQVEPVY